MHVEMSTIVHTGVLTNKLVKNTNFIFSSYSLISLQIEYLIRRLEIESFIRIVQNLFLIRFRNIIILYMFVLVNMAIITKDDFN